jgi:16S rRNA (guanine1207-N2)-methyltransferase
MLTKKNAEVNNVEINALQSDIFSNIKENFDAILVNLPQHAGKDICFKMIEESYKHLNSNGSLQAVSRHQKGGKSYQKKMEEVFGNCTDIGKGSGYRVYMSVKQ